MGQVVQHLELGAASIASAEWPRAIATSAATVPGDATIGQEMQVQPHRKEWRRDAVPKLPPSSNAEASVGQTTGSAAHLEQQ